MSQRCPHCNGPVRVGYRLPDGQYIPSYRASRADAAVAERKTRYCLGCGHEPVGKDALAPRGDA